MIITTATELGRYRGLSAALDRAISWIREGGLESFAPGKHEIDGDRVFALASSYETKPAGEVLFETHRKYIDIQMLSAGREYILVRDAAPLPVRTAYSDEKDIAFQEDAPGEVQRVALAPGIVAILFPEDAHKPCLRIGEGPESVRKIVVKVRVS